MNQIEDKIDLIFKSNDEYRNKFHEFRTTLNPEHHTDTLTNSENVRNFARGMIEFMYSIHCPELTIHHPEDSCA